VGRSARVAADEERGRRNQVLGKIHFRGGESGVASGCDCRSGYKNHLKTVKLSIFKARGEPVRRNHLLADSLRKLILSRRLLKNVEGVGPSLSGGERSQAPETFTSGSKKRS